MIYTSRGSQTAGCCVSLWKKFTSPFIIWTRSWQFSKNLWAT